VDVRLVWAVGRRDHTRFKARLSDCLLYAIFSLFPFTLLSIGIASFSLGPLMDQHLIVQRIEFIAPALGQLLGKNIDEIIRARGPSTSVILVGLIWSASTIFCKLTQTPNEIWSNKRRRPI
jgi:uncharacterized BrkB/YihY/UPF0761 family membrane protein